MSATEWSSTATFVVSDTTTKCVIPSTVLLCTEHCRTATAHALVCTSRTERKGKAVRTRETLKRKKGRKEERTTLIVAVLYQKVPGDGAQMPLDRAALDSLTGEDKGN